MTRIDEFERALDMLLYKFRDLPSQDIADSLDYYTARYQRYANEENEDEK